MTDWQTITKLAEHEPMDLGAATVFRMVPRDAGQTFSTGFSNYEPGSIDVDVPRDECFLVVDGELEITQGGKSWTVGAGEAIWMPAGSNITATARVPTRTVYVIAMK